MDYNQFLEKKTQLGGNHGFDPVFMPEFLFDFQKLQVEWALQKGRAALFNDCGLGKTPMQLVWAENVLRKIVCDESSVLKHFSGATQKQVTRFMSKIPYRLLCTATASPNDYTELGTSSEALGYLGYSDMITRFFKMNDKKRSRMNDVKLARAVKQANTQSNYFQKLSYRVSQQIEQYRLKGHAEEPFWKWICSWARACRKPSDLGFQDNDFKLPELIEKDHVIMPDRPAEGMLFTVRALGLAQEREERKRTLKQRCEFVAGLVDHDRPSVIWCHMNPEGELLNEIIPDSVEVSGSTPDEKREEIYLAFAAGQIKRLITKPKIGAWGMNWQHCHDTVTFASHSYEQYYQSIRRFLRFGQKHPVTVHRVATEGERHVFDNMNRKADATDKMFTELVKHMNDALHIEKKQYSFNTNLPTWLTNKS